MVETSRFFVSVSLLFCAATVVYGFAEPLPQASPTVAAFAVPASTPAAIPAALSETVVPSVPVFTPTTTATTSPVETPLPVVAPGAAVPPPTVSPATPEPVVTPPAPAPKPREIAAPVSLSELATLIHTETNKARRAEGLPPLRYDATLAANATAYSRRMQREDFLGHTDPEGCALTCRFAASGYEALAWGENLARWRSSYDPEATELATYFMREWLRSDGHRDNILSPDFTVQGIGFSIDGGEVYVTVHFADPA